MSTRTLLVVAYDDVKVAERAAAELRTLADEHKLTLGDEAVVVRKPDGKVALHQLNALAAGEGVVAGGSIGVLLGLAFGIPVAGAVVGLGGGGGVSLIDRGIRDSELRRIGGTLEPGRAAVFALVGDADWAAVRERLGPYGGDVVASDVAADVVAELRSSEP